MSQDCSCSTGDRTVRALQTGCLLALMMPSIACCAHTVSTRILMETIIEWIKCLGIKGYLAIDDVVVEKPFSQCVSWVG
jgi:hypothetical protein